MVTIFLKSLKGIKVGPRLVVAILLGYLVIRIGFFSAGNGYYVEFGI